MPTLRERIGAWIAFGRKSTQAMEFHEPFSNYFGGGLGLQPSAETLLTESLGIADAGGRAIADRLASLEPLVKISRQVDAETLKDEIIDDHPLVALLERPHPNFSRAQMFRLTGQWMTAVGAAHWLKVGNGLGIPMELHPIPPARIEPGWEAGVIKRYIIYNSAGSRTTLEPDSVIRMAFPDPADPYSVEGYLAPMGLEADSTKFAGEHLRSHYQNDATPKTYLKPGQDATTFTPEQRDEFLMHWRNAYHNRLGTQRGGPGMVPTGYELIEMAMQSGAEITPLLEFWRDNLLMGYRVPRSVLGQVVSGDRSSAETNQYVFDLHGILPLARLIEDALTYQLAKDFEPPGLFVEFAPFVSEDKEFNLRQEQSDLDRKLKSINIALEGRGENTVDWGELPVGKIGEMPYDVSGGMELIPDVEGALGEEEEEEERARGARPSPADYDTKTEFMEACVPMVVAEGKTNKQAVGQCSGMWEDPSVRVLPFFSPAAEWERQVVREKKYTPSFQRAMVSIFAQQKRIVLDRLKKLEPRARISPDDLFSPDEWESLFRVRVDPIREIAFKAMAAETFAGLGIEEEFIFTDAMQKQLGEQGAQLIQHANRTTKRRIARALQDAVAEGEGVEGIAKRVRHVFNVRRHEARTIARTEVLKSSQTAQIESFEQSGVVEKKQWNTSMDDAVRETHLGIAEPIVGLRMPFTLGDGEQADAPGIGIGGTALSAENSINCRCFVTPVMEAKT